MENGEWKMENGKWRMKRSDIPYPQWSEIDNDISFLIL